MLVAASRNRSDSASRVKASPPSNVRVRAFVVATGAVTLVRSGRRLVPENLDMTPSSLGCWPRVFEVSWVFGGGDRSGQGTGWTSGAELNGRPRGPLTPKKIARPSHLTGSLQKHRWLRGHDSNAEHLAQNQG